MLMYPYRFSTISSDFSTLSAKGNLHRVCNVAILFAASICLHLPRCPPRVRRLIRHPTLQVTSRWTAGIHPASCARRCPADKSPLSAGSLSRPYIRLGLHPLWPPQTLRSVHSHRQHSAPATLKVRNLSLALDDAALASPPLTPRQF